MPAESWAIHEHSNITADGPPFYPFKTVIPVAGAFLLVQGIVEIIRCVICLKQGDWPSRVRRTCRKSTSTSSRHMVHVKDEDIAKLDRFVVAQEEPPQMRKEVWFGLSIMAAGGHRRCSS